MYCTCQCLGVVWLGAQRTTEGKTHKRVFKGLSRDFLGILYLDRANGRGGFGSQTAADPPATLEEP